jgi:hypothetical protein
MPEINECSPIVIFPMEVECSVINPTTYNGTNGSATLTINGGSSPYTIIWDIGNNTRTITNLPAGSYSATIVDYYGDYTARTTCVLVNPTQPTSTPPEPTPTPPPTYNFCMTIMAYNQTYTNTTTQIHFNQIGSDIWKSDDNVYTLSFDTINSRWVVTPSPVPSGQVINQNLNNPPLTGWQVLGGYGGNPTVEVKEGECVTNAITSFKYNVNQPSCICDGAVVIGEIVGGTSPYQFSKDNGITYQTTPLFNNLCGNQTLTLVVKDFNGLISAPQTVTTGSQIGGVTYVLNLHYNPNINQTFYIDVTPPLPAGASINFNLINNTILTQSPNTNVASWIFDMNLLVDSVIITPSVSTTNLPSVTENFCGPTQWRYATKSGRTWSNIEITNNTTSINGAWTEILTYIGTGSCDRYGTSWELYIDPFNFTTSGLDCDTVVVNNPYYDNVGGNINN